MQTNTNFTTNTLNKHKNTPAVFGHKALIRFLNRIVKYKNERSIRQKKVFATKSETKFFNKLIIYEYTKSAKEKNLYQQ